MPESSSSSEGPLEAALAAVSRGLTSTGAPWMVIGGLAIIAHGVRRMTTDIDVVVKGDAVELPSLLNALAEVEIEPRIEEAEAFAQQNLVLLLEHVPTEVEIDLSLGWTGFEAEALDACESLRFGHVEARMARAEDLIIYKALAMRARDIDDGAALLTMHTVDLDRIRRHVRALADLAGLDPDGALPEMERLAAISRSARPPKPRRKAKKPTGR